MKRKAPTPRCKGCGTTLDVKRRGQAGMPLSWHLTGNIHCCQEYADLDDAGGRHIDTYPGCDVPVILDSLHYEMVDNQQTTMVAIKGVTILGQTQEFCRVRKFTEAAEVVQAMKDRSRQRHRVAPATLTSAALFRRVAMQRKESKCSG